MNNEVYQIDDTMEDGESDKLDEILDNPDFDLFEALISYVRPEVDYEGHLEDEPGISINLTNQTLRSIRFEGDCIETGASKFLVGRRQEEDSYEFMGIPLVIKKGRKMAFRFGSQRTISHGYVQFCIPYDED